MSADRLFQVPRASRAVPACRQPPPRRSMCSGCSPPSASQAVEDWLVARRITTSATVAAARQDLTVLVARLAQAGRVPRRRTRRAGGPEACSTLRRPRARSRGRRGGRHRFAARRRPAAAERTARWAHAAAAAARRAGPATALDGVRPEHEALEVAAKAAARAAELRGVLDEAAERERPPWARRPRRRRRALLTAVGLPVEAESAALRAAAADARRRGGRLEGLRSIADVLAADSRSQRRR